MGYAYMRWFLNAAHRVLVSTPAMAKRLKDHGVRNVVSCPLGVDTERFKPGDKGFLQLPRPIYLNVGRLTKEKNIESFLALNLPGTKLIVGDGPLRSVLQQKYPDVHFAGIKTGDSLVQYYAASDCFVFPSRTDTFGLVMLEALAVGLPVAAYPVTGPVDVVTDPTVGCLDTDLARAATIALTLSPSDCRNFALLHSWAESTRRFMAYQVLCRLSGYASDNRHGTWLERTWLDLLYRGIEKLVDHIEQMLFGNEPEGPYASKDSRKI
jgi:glycosyltransferase involved in cell wall biosynthesis